MKVFLRSHEKFINVIQKTLFKAETNCWGRLPAIFQKHRRHSFDVWWSGLWAPRGKKIRTTFWFFFKYWKWGGTIKKSCISINFNLFPVDLYYTIAFTAQGNQSFNREIKINGEQVFFQMTLKKWMTDNIIIGSRSYWPNYLLFCRLDWCDSCWWRYLLRSSWCFCC